MAQIDTIELLLDFITNTSDIDEATRDVGELAGGLEGLDKTTSKPDVELQAGDTQAEIAAIATELAALDAMDKDVNIGAVSQREGVFGPGMLSAISQREGTFSPDAPLPVPVGDERGGRIIRGVPGSGLDLSRGPSPLGMRAPTVGGLDVDRSSFEGMRRRIRRANRSLERFDDRFGNINLRMSQWHDLLADLIPLLIVLIMALPAVITALGALATAALASGAALGSVAGLGLFGVAAQRSGGTQGAGESLMEMAGNAVDEIASAFEPLARTFAPLMRDAFQAVSNFIQELAEEAQILRSIRDVARDFGNFLLEAFGGFFTRIARLTEAFQPVFSMIADWFSEVDIVGSLVHHFADMFPTLRALTQQVLGFIDVLVSLSKGFLFAARVIFGIIGVVWDLVFGFLELITFTLITEEKLGALVGVLLAMVTVVIIAVKIEAAYNTVMSTGIGIRIKKIAVEIKETIVMVANMAANHLKISSEIALIGTTLAAAGAIGILWSVLSFGILPIVASLIGGFSILGGEMEDVDKKLRAFNMEDSGLMTGTGNTSGRGAGSGNIIYNNNIEVNGGDPYEQRREGRKLFQRQRMKDSVTSTR